MFGMGGQGGGEGGGGPSFGSQYSDESQTRGIQEQNSKIPGSGVSAPASSGSALSTFGGGLMQREPPNQMTSDDPYGPPVSPEAADGMGKKLFAGGASGLAAGGAQLSGMASPMGKQEPRHGIDDTDGIIAALYRSKARKDSAAANLAKTQANSNIGSIQQMSAAPPVTYQSLNNAQFSQGMMPPMQGYQAPAPAPQPMAMNDSQGLGAQADSAINDARYLGQY